MCHSWLCSPAFVWDHKDGEIYIIGCVFCKRFVHLLNLRFCLQIPYAQHYSLVFYFVTEEDITEGSLLHRFISGDDTFRNSRLSLIPAIPEVGVPMINDRFGYVVIVRNLHICYAIEFFRI